MVGDLDLWCDAMRCGCNVKQEGDHRGAGCRTLSQEPFLLHATTTTTAASHEAAPVRSAGYVMYARLYGRWTIHEHV